MGATTKVESSNIVSAVHLRTPLYAGLTDFLARFALFRH
jgi:hypothetical protein